LRKKSAIGISGTDCPALTPVKAPSSIAITTSTTVPIPFFCIHISFCVLGIYLLILSLQSGHRRDRAESHA
jgi:hypothetical protein